MEGGGGREGGREEGRVGGRAIMEWAHMAWFGCSGVSRGVFWLPGNPPGHDFFNLP